MDIKHNAWSGCFMIEDAVLVSWRHWWGKTASLPCIHQCLGSGHQCTASTDTNRIKDFTDGFSSAMSSTSRLHLLSGNSVKQAFWSILFYSLSIFKNSV